MLLWLTLQGRDWIHLWLRHYRLCHTKAKNLRGWIEINNFVCILQFRDCHLYSFCLLFIFDASNEKAKDEKRPWILRAREASVLIREKTEYEENQSLPQTLIYISCGWESFKEVWLSCAMIPSDTSVFSSLLSAIFFLKLIFLQDCMSLVSSKAWHLEKAHGFNFFPGTQR